MTQAALSALMSPAQPVTLAELDASAALLTRRDRKYLVPWEDAERFLAQLTPRASVLEIGGERTFAYRSVYFDTPTLDSYLGAARRRPRRFKVRTRSYLDSQACQLEVKTRDPRGRTVKQRVEHPFDRSDHLGSAGLAFVSDCRLTAEAATLRPVLTTRYARTTLLLDEGARVTVDVELQAEGPDGRVVGLAGMAVIETKSEGAPCAADRLLWRLGHRPIKVSKFGTSLSALYPALPSNKWTQALRRPWLEARSLPAGGQVTEARRLTDQEAIEALEHHLAAPICAG